MKKRPRSKLFLALLILIEVAVLALIVMLVYEKYFRPEDKEISKGRYANAREVCFSQFCSEEYAC